ncbi:MAG: hypothetical protein QM608_15330 [Caulobacter sp.]
MTLALRARLAWIPFALWVAFSAFWLVDRLRTRPPEGPLDWTASALIYGGAFVAGLYVTMREVKRWAGRVRVEGGDLRVPITWHRRSGSWLVIGMFAVMVAMFGGLSLIAART